MINARLKAEKVILKRKLDAEARADRNLDNALVDDNIRVLFVKCKKLVVEIAKLEVDGKDASAQRKEYNDTRELLAQVLKEMGIDKSELKPQYACTKCKDTGYIGGVECECLKREISLMLIEESGINIKSMPTFESCNFEIFDDAEKMKTVYSKMKKYIDELDNTQIDNILITGNTGVGKTHLIDCMATYALSKGKQIKYTTAFNFNQDMLKFHCARLEEKSIIIDEYRNCEILFLDDLGTETKINNVTDEYLYSIINERQYNHKKTIITTNLNLKQIQDVYGERIFSRLMHKKQSLKINLEGDDLRIKNTKKK